MWARAEVSWEESGGIHIVPGTIEDTSPSGACVRVKHPFTIGSRVTIKWSREQFSAVARNCKQDGRDFLLGVKREASENSSSGKPALQNPGKAAKAQAVSLVKNESMPATPSKVQPAAPKQDSVRERTIPDSSVEQRVPDRAHPPKERPQSHSRDSSPRHERNDMEPKRLFPQFWHRQQGGDVPNPVTPKEAAVNKTNTEPARGPQSELLSYEDIYRASGIMSSRSGYGIHKIVDMLNNERIRDLSPDAKRASVLMALDAAGTSVDELLQDALRRQSALDSYEAGQRKQVEEFEVRKTAENARIEAELERVRAHYAERMQSNRDQVAREKEALRNWQMAMQHETQRISDVIELCGRRGGAAPRANAATAGAGSTAAAKSDTAAGDAIHNAPARPNSSSGQ